MKDEYKFFKKPATSNPSPRHGDLRRVNIPVDVVFEHVDNIVDDVDDEGNPTSYKSGFVMRIINTKPIVYNNEPSIYLGSVSSAPQ